MAASAGCRRRKVLPQAGLVQLGPGRCAACPPTATGETAHFLGHRPAFLEVNEASGKEYTCSTKHQTDNTPAARSIRQTIHLQQEASGRQYTCSTKHQTDNTPAARDIRQRIHLQHEGSGKEYTCSTRHQANNTPAAGNKRKGETVSLAEGSAVLWKRYLWSSGGGGGS